MGTRCWEDGGNSSDSDEEAIHGLMSKQNGKKAKVSKSNNASKTAASESMASAIRSLLAKQSSSSTDSKESSTVDATPKQQVSIKEQAKDIMDARTEKKSKKSTSVGPSLLDEALQAQRAELTAQKEDAAVKAALRHARHAKRDHFHHILYEDLTENSSSGDASQGKVSAKIATASSAKVTLPWAPPTSSQERMLKQIAARAVVDLLNQQAIAAAAANGSVSGTKSKNEKDASKRRFLFHAKQQQQKASADGEPSVDSTSSTGTSGNSFLDMLRSGRLI